MTSNKTGPSIAVAMSTYNGERFLQEQIDSILKQEEVKLDLFVRDDGSTDRTVSILREYDYFYGNVHVCFGKNEGVGNSFMDAFYAIPSQFDFYAFADQDDIWMPDKCRVAIEKLQETGKSLYASNQECIDANGKSLGLRYGDSQYIHLKPVEVISYNMISGCTFVFPSVFADELRERRFSRDLLQVRIHDVSVAAAASVTGGIYYDNNAYIKYRQHENNVVGVKETTFIDDIKNKIKKAQDKSKRNGRSRLAKEIMKLYPVDSDRVDMIQECASPGLFKSKKRLICSSGELCKYTGETQVGFIIKVLLGLF